MRWKCQCMYDGTDFSGWQSQPNRNGIQDYIEYRLNEIFKYFIRIHGSGRTDAGVHARQQVFHFDAEWQHGENRLLAAMMARLRKDIHIFDIQSVDVDFHARYSVKCKRYVYYIYLGQADPFKTRYCWSIGNQNVDVDRINAFAQNLIGTHNFLAFGANRGEDVHDNPIKTLYKLDFHRNDKDLIVTTEGSGYLYKMVRTLTATLLNLGLGRINEEYILDCFHNNIRREHITTAPAQGLFLDKVLY